MPPLIVSAIAALAVLLAGSAAIAGSARSGTAGIHRVPVTSYAERPFHRVVRQQYDYSCGSAALATLLRFHYRRPISEQEIFRAMYAAGDRGRIQEAGFSLLDMKLYLATLGLRADGFRISLDHLARVGVPAISLIEVQGYRHFVVIKGIRGDQVLVGDPAKGVRAFSKAAFERVRVDDIVFVVRDATDAAKASFNEDADWALRQVAAPAGAGVPRTPVGAHGALAPAPRRSF